MKKTILVLSIIFTTQVFSFAYRGGDSYNRVVYKSSSPNNYTGVENDFARRMGKIVVSYRQVNTGTAFFLEERNNGYLFITNFHILGATRACKKTIIITKDDNGRLVKSKCRKVIKLGKYKNGHDYTYFLMRKTSANSYFSKLSKTQRVSQIPRVGTPLLQLGFGGASSSARSYNLKLSKDGDCVLLSQTLMNIEMSDGYFTKNSLSTSCDSESGDSGGAIIERDTGKLVALYYGAYGQKKKSDFMSSEYIKSNLDQNPKMFRKGSWGMYINNILFDGM